VCINQTQRYVSSKHVAVLAVVIFMVAALAVVIFMVAALAVLIFMCCASCSYLTMSKTGVWLCGSIQLAQHNVLVDRMDCMYVWVNQSLSPVRVDALHLDRKRRVYLVS